MTRAPAKWDMEADVAVVGSGSGALTGALLTHDRGGKAILMEASGKLGGGTAYSGGVEWMPNNHLMKQQGLHDSQEEALTYLRGISGGKHSEEVLQAFLDKGPGIFRYLEEHTGIRWQIAPGYPDYYSEWPGGKPHGRYVHPQLFDAKTLGEWRTKVYTSPHNPVPSTAAEMHGWGGRVSVTRWDWKLIGERLKADIRGFGAAYIGFLVKACLDRGVTILLNTRGRELVQDDAGRVIGVRAEQDGKSLYIRARKGVLLGCGGFEWNEEMKARTPEPRYESITVPTNQGDGLIMGLEIGAAMAFLDQAITPAMHVPGEEQEGKALYRHFVMTLASPGAIVVNKESKRFANDGFYRALGYAMCLFDAARETYPNLPCYAIFDHKFKDTYAVGPSMPGDPTPSWLTTATTLQELAQKLGIDADSLENTVSYFNRYAQEGKDPLFHRGETIYDKYMGDPDHKPNPSLAPIEKPPYYGYQILLASGGTRSGLVINGQAQVMNVRGIPIPALYACPNTAAHLVNGMAYNSGICNGTSTVFGFLAAEHAMKSKQG